ncbi:low temperature requirement protein A [Nonomuraea sp. NPDC050556]|uniref:low temperature requirement protein A n=1 Tax=Nonomuraea sp. NPDC050556 TaxID=3364369 RepID=UPI0037B2EECF
MTMLRPMLARNPGEQHRAATPLELFFDLVFVVAVAQAAASLHHSIVEHHVGAGLLGYVLVFFLIWWAWMQWTWFASSFDNDDLVYRLSTFVTMFGVLVVAAGVESAFAGDFRLSMAGYVIMRLALVSQWLRAAGSNREIRRDALSFAIGTSLFQLGWIGRLWLTGAPSLVAFAVLAAAEIMLPAWIGRHGSTPWHKHHIVERYGLFTIIVLGESVLAATIAVKRGANTGEMIVIAVSGLVIVCSMWWLYFARSGGRMSDGAGLAIWSYGHYLLFASAAAVGAGLAVAVDTGKGAVVAVSVAAFLVSLWLTHIAWHRGAWAQHTVYLVTAALVLATSLTPWPVPATAVVLVVAGVAGARLPWNR